MIGEATSTKIFHANVKSSFEDLRKTRTPKIVIGKEKCIFAISNFISRTDE